MSVVGYWNGSFVNPDEAQVPIDERGHQFGDGVYEVVRVYGGRPFLLEMHLDRLDQSLAWIGIPNPHSQAAWTDVIHEAIRRSGEAEALVYFQVTRGISPRGHVFPSVPPSVSLTVRPFEARSAGEAVLLALPDERWANAFVKTLNLLPNVLAKETAHRAGATEALLVRDGHVTEGSSSNAWFVRDNALITAPDNRWILNGISRQFTLQLAQRLGLTVELRALPWASVATVDEVFMTGTTIEVMPVQEIWVQQAMESQLLKVPDRPSGSLVPQLGTLRKAWSAQRFNRVGTELRAAFLEEVERFRGYAETVVG